MSASNLLKQLHFYQINIVSTVGNFF